MGSYLCGVRDRGQLQVLGVPPPEEAAIDRHSQAAVPVGGHLDHVHSGKVSSQLGGRTGDIVVTQTWNNGKLCYLLLIVYFFNKHLH